MAINRVDYAGEVLIDLTGDTLTAAGQLANGVVAHAANGETVTGTHVCPTPTYDTPSITVSTGGLITASANGKSNTQQLTTQATKTVTPTKSSQTAVASGRYTTGTVTVGAIPTEYIVPSGSQTLNENKVYDVTSLASVTVAVPIPTFVTVRTGSTNPPSTLGNDGDLYLKLV